MRIITGLSDKFVRSSWGVVDGLTKARVDATPATTEASNMPPTMNTNVFFDLLLIPPLLRSLELPFKWLPLFASFSDRSALNVLALTLRLYSFVMTVFLT